MLLRQWRRHSSSSSSRCVNASTVINPPHPPRQRQRLFGPRWGKLETEQRLLQAQQQQQQQQQQHEEARQQIGMAVYTHAQQHLMAMTSKITGMILENGATQD
jgi:hypothetical protein